MARILLIDDDPDVLKTMGMILKQRGFEVETASKREQVFASLEMVRPALILMDVLLSGEDGRELCREIKAKETTKKIPVIMFSGHPVAAVKFEDYGADDFVAKPINLNLLLEKIDKQLQTA